MFASVYGFTPQQPIAFTVNGSTDKNVSPALIERIYVSVHLEAGFTSV